MATFTNQATLTYNNTTTNSNIVTGELLEVLSVTKTAVVDTFDADGAVTYVVSIVNSGSTDFTGLTLTDNLGGYEQGTPAVTRYPLAYDDDSLLYYVNGTLQTTPTVTAGPPLTVENISVPANGNATIIYEADVTDYAPRGDESAITNEAALSGGGLANAVTATETVTAAAGPALTITKNISPASVAENGRITYTLTLVNTGNVAATAADNIVITDTFDPILSDITVALDGTTLTATTDYTYDEATGLFTTTAGRITVPAATFTQQEDGTWTTEPGVAVLTVSGTV